MSRLRYIATPEITPDSRNDKFYEDISNSWQSKAENLQVRRWEKINLRNRH